MSFVELSRITKKLLSVSVLVVCAAAIADDNRGFLYRKVGDVSKTMCLWQPNVRYETTLTLYFEAHNVSITGATPDGKKITTELGNKPLVHRALLKYSTQWLNGNRDQGSALRNYAIAQLGSGDTDDMKVTVTGFSCWERVGHIIRKYTGEGTDYDLIESGPFKDYIVVRPKKELVGDKLDELKPMFELIPALRNRGFILSWTSATQARNAAMKIAIADANGSPSQTEQPPEIVADVIKREASLLYNAVLGDKERKAGDLWTLDGSVLGGLIYPTLKSAFDGQAVVRAEAFQMASPPLERFATGDGSRKLDAFNGIHLMFCPAGTIEGQRVVSNLRYRTEAADGGQREIRVDFSDPSKVVGDMYVDTDRQMIRHAYLKVTDADYSGSIPKFGSLPVNAQVKGGIVLHLQYDCVPVSYQP